MNCNDAAADDDDNNDADDDGTKVNFLKIHGILVQCQVSFTWMTSQSRHFMDPSW